MEMFEQLLSFPTKQNKQKTMKQVHIWSVKTDIYEAL